MKNIVSISAKFKKENSDDWSSLIISLYDYYCYYDIILTAGGHIVSLTNI